jgi:multiple sugar transport system substrate-binding protein
VITVRPVTRRAVLGGLLAAPLSAACAGFDTSGAAAPGTVGFLSTQFTPVEERQRYEQVLRSQLRVPVAYNPVEGGVFTTTISSQARAKNVRTALVGGLYNDLAPLADAFDDVSALLRDLSGAGVPDTILKLTTLGGSTPKFVPWMQATYVVAVNKQALQWLPTGADVRDLTYDQYLAWAPAAQAATGRPAFGLPAGR